MTLVHVLNKFYFILTIRAVIGLMCSCKSFCLFCKMGVCKICLLAVSDFSSTKSHTSDTSVLHSRVQITRLQFFILTQSVDVCDSRPYYCCMGYSCYHYYFMYNVLIHFVSLFSIHRVSIKMEDLFLVSK